MHEMAVAQGIVDQAVEAARRHGAKMIEEIVVKVGVLEHIDADALQTAFEVVREDSLASSAVLIVESESAQVRCRECRHEFAPSLEPPSFLCPQCQQASGDILAGKGIILQSLVCPDPCMESEETSS